VESKVEKEDKVKVKSKDIRSMFTKVSKKIEVPKVSNGGETQHVVELSDSDSEF
jgi:hypothetical protein